MLRLQTKKNKDRIRVVVQIEGRCSLEGHMFITPGGRIIDLLNDERDFLPLELMSGDSVIIRKSEIQMVEPRLNDENVDPLFLGTAREIYGINAYTTQEELKKTYQTIIDRLHPDLITKAGLHPALASCAEMLTERLISSYDDAEDELIRETIKSDKIRRVKAAIDAENKRQSTAHKSA